MVGKRSAPNPSISQLTSPRNQTASRRWRSRSVNSNHIPGGTDPTSGNVKLLLPLWVMRHVNLRRGQSGVSGAMRPDGSFRDPLERGAPWSSRFASIFCQRDAFPNPLLVLRFATAASTTALERPYKASVQSVFQPTLALCAGPSCYA